MTTALAQVHIDRPLVASSSLSAVYDRIATHEVYQFGKNDRDALKIIKAARTAKAES